MSADHFRDATKKVAMSAEPVPVARVQRMGSYQGIPALGCLLSIEAEKRLKVNDPLYDRATLDAAVAAARAEERAARDAEIAALQTRLDRCQRGHMTRLSDPEMKPAMDVVMQRIKDDPSYRVSLLHKAGIVNEDGTLSEDYKP